MRTHRRAPDDVPSVRNLPHFCSSGKPGLRGYGDTFTNSLIYCRLLALVFCGLGSRPVRAARRSKKSAYRKRCSAPSAALRLRRWTGDTACRTFTIPWRISATRITSASGARASEACGGTTPQSKSTSCIMARFRVGLFARRSVSVSLSIVPAGIAIVWRRYFPNTRTR